MFNAPFSNTRSVVELALAEIIALTRRLTEKNAGMHAGRLGQVRRRAATRSAAARLGIVGYGNIGTQLSVLAENLGMPVLLLRHRRQARAGQRAPLRHASTSCSTTVDVVTLHVDGRPGNSGFFGEDAVRRGCGRAACSSTCPAASSSTTRALRRHIESGHLAGAAVDVFPDEPKGRGDEFVSELRGLPNVILTPHIGGSTEEAQQDIGEFVAGKLRDFVHRGHHHAERQPAAARAAAAAGTHRLAHLHRNTPGRARRRSTASWPSTRSTSRASCSAPAASSATC